MGKLEGRIAIVTGDTRGQGEAEVRLFVEEGARVIVADVLDDAGRALAADIGPEARFCHLDVSDPGGWSAVVAETASAFGPPCVLVNNAGILKVGSIEEMPVEDYLSVVHVNQLGCWLGMKSVVGPIRGVGGGSIVNISSTAGLIGMPNLTAYVASKWAIRGMTKAAAAELGVHGIRVNSIHPGAVDTDMGGGSAMTRAEKDALFVGQPVARVGIPEDIARLALFLASDDSGYCTGAEFVADGGSVCAMQAAGGIGRR